MTLIVTKPNSRLLERDRIRIHNTREEASAYGKDVYGYSNFKIQNYNQWRKTETAKIQIIKIETLNRWNKFK